MLLPAAVLLFHEVHKVQHLLLFLRRQIAEFFENLLFDGQNGSRPNFVDYTSADAIPGFAPTSVVTTKLTIAFLRRRSTRKILLPDCVRSDCIPTALNLREEKTLCRKNRMMDAWITSNFQP